MCLTLHPFCSFFVLLTRKWLSLFTIYAMKQINSIDSKIREITGKMHAIETTCNITRNESNNVRCMLLYNKHFSPVQSKIATVYASHSLCIVALMECVHNKCIFVHVPKSVFD